MFEKINIKEKSFWTAIILMHLVFFIFQLFNGQYSMADSKEYLLEANNIKDHWYFYCGDISQDLNYDLLTKRTFLYPLMLSLFLLISKQFWLIIFVQALLSILNIFLLIKVLKLFQIQIHFGTLFLFILFTPAQFIYSNMIMSELLFQTCITAGFVAFLYYYKIKDPKYLWMYVLAIVLAMLTKPAFYLFAYANIIMMLIFYLLNKDFKPILLALLPIFFVMGFSYWNQSRTGHFHFSSISKINALNYNTYYFLMDKIGAEKAEQKVDAILNKAKSIEDYNAQSQFIKASTKEILSDHFLNYLFYHFKGSVLFFLDPGRFDLASFFGIEGKTDDGFLHQKNKSGGSGIIAKLKSQPLLLLFSLGIIFLFNLIKLGCIIRFFFLKNMDWIPKLLCLGIIFYLALLTGPLGASRFALPVFMLVLFTVVTVVGNNLQKRLV